MAEQNAAYVRDARWMESGEAASQSAQSTPQNRCKRLVCLSGDINTFRWVQHKLLEIKSCFVSELQEKKPKI